MCHGSQNRHTEFLSGIGGCRTCHTADKGSSGTIIRCIKVMRATGTKLHNGSALRCFDDTLCLCCNQGLMIDTQQHCRFQQLCFDNLRLYANQRFIREHRCSFLHRKDITGKNEMPQIFQKFIIKAVQRTQVCNITILKMQILDISDNFLQPRKHRIAAAVRISAIKQVKGDNTILMIGIEVALTHGQLIKIHDQT